MAVAPHMHMSRPELAPYPYPEAADPTSSRQRLNEYFDLRAQAVEITKPDGDALAAIQASTQAWIKQEGLEETTRYDQYDEGPDTARIKGLINYLRQRHSDQISEVELKASEVFLEATFGMYAATPDVGVADDTDGSFAFVVPVRATSERSDFGKEMEMICPALRYVRHELKDMLTVGLPPLVLDNYAPDAQGRRGYLVLAPIHADMRKQMSTGEMVNRARQNVDDAVNFAQRRLGARLVGLGATLPAVTNYGQTITNRKVLTTTGHGGTIHFINETVYAAYQKGLISEEAIRNINVTGLGAIGGTVAEIAAARFPEAEIGVYDRRQGMIKRTTAALGDRTPPVRALGETEVFGPNRVVISAVTSQINLDALGVEDLQGTLVVDDSQPSGVDEQQVLARRGHLVWVVGHTTGDVAVRGSYDYATLVDAHRDLFGCEAEVAVLMRYMQELEERELGIAESIIGRMAIRDAVTVEQVHYIGLLFKKYGIEVAQFQMDGHLVAQGNQAANTRRKPEPVRRAVDAELVRRMEEVAERAEPSAVAYANATHGRTLAKTAYKVAPEQSDSIVMDETERDDLIAQYVVIRHGYSSMEAVPRSKRDVVAQDIDRTIQWSKAAPRSEREAEETARGLVALSEANHRGARATYLAQQYAAIVARRKHDALRANVENGLSQPVRQQSRHAVVNVARRLVASLF